MTATIAHLAALLFAGIVAYRFKPDAPRMLGLVALVLALVGIASGVSMWRQGGDTRWLVGAILLIAAAPAAVLAVRGRAFGIAALVLGVLALVLFGLATASPMRL